MLLAPSLLKLSVSCEDELFNSCVDQRIEDESQRLQQLDERNSAMEVSDEKVFCYGSTRSDVDPTRTRERI
jgi:hypothetical protein